jgi:hypothetical protein
MPDQAATSTKIYRGQHTARLGDIHPDPFSILMKAKQTGHNTSWPRLFHSIKLSVLFPILLLFHQLLCITNAAVILPVDLKKLDI